MRTTLNIDDAVQDRARAVAAKLRIPFRHVVNEALRVGLQAVEKPASERPYQTRARRMGLKEGRSLGKIQELIAQVEGEEHL